MLISAAAAMSTVPAITPPARIAYAMHGPMPDSGSNVMAGSPQQFGANVMFHETRDEHAGLIRALYEMRLVGARQTSC
jgi:hypothetical protein